MSEQVSPTYLLLAGSGGIGSSVAQRLVAVGGLVTITARDAGCLAEAGARTGASTAVLDARDAAAVDEAVKAAHSRHGRLDGVVNCPGANLLKPAHLIDDEEFTDAIATNSTTSFHVLHSAARIMMRQPGGDSIVPCSSAAARRGVINHEAIAAAKSGVEGLPWPLQPRTRATRCA